MTDFTTDDVIAVGATSVGSLSHATYIYAETGPARSKIIRYRPGVRATPTDATTPGVMGFFEMPVDPNRVATVATSVIVYDSS